MLSVAVTSSLDEQEDTEVNKRITILKRYVFIEDYFLQTKAKILKMCSKNKVYHHDHLNAYAPACPADRKLLSKNVISVAIVFG
jgi:hypothetical protein